MKRINPANRLSDVSASAMRALFEIAKQMRAEGKKVIDFGLGDIDIPLPDVVKEGIKSAVEKGKTKYGPNQGEVILREKLSELYNQQHNLSIDIANVLVTCGSLESLYDIAMAYVNPGDEVLIVEPEFAYFGWQVKLAGGIVKPISTDLSTKFVVTPEQIQESITSKTKALLINYPNNPTGGILNTAQFKAIVEVCEDNEVLLISDEAYEKMMYDGLKHNSALDFGYENTLVLNSASKALCMTGLRVGYTVSNSKELLAPVVQVHQYNTAHAAVNNQYGVLAGLENETQILAQNLEILQKRRDTITSTWKEIPGLKFSNPQATFYFYPNIAETGMDGQEFTEFALKHGVVLTPGNAFCFNKNNPGGKEHIRVSYGMCSEEEIRDGGLILKEALENR